MNIAILLSVHTTRHIETVRHYETEETVSPVQRVGFANTSRKRTQRTFALESAVIADHQSVLSGNRKTRRIARKVKHLADTRLHTLKDLVRDPSGIVCYSGGKYLHYSDNQKRIIMRDIRDDFSCSRNWKQRDIVALNSDAIRDNSFSLLGVSPEPMELAYHKNILNLDTSAAKQEHRADYTTTENACVELTTH